MAPVAANQNVCLADLRGGTHVVFQRGGPDPSADAPFDLMTEDLDGMHAATTTAGHVDCPIASGSVQSWFVVTDHLARSRR